MQINYKALTVELTDDIRAYTEEKIAMVEKLIAGVDPDNVSVDIDLSRKQNQKSGDIFRADITMHAGADRTHAVGHGETLMAALDEAKDELSRRLRRSKTRRLDSIRRGGAKIKNALRFWK